MRIFASTYPTVLTSSTKTICDGSCVRPLRYRYFWFFGGLCLVGFVLYLTLTPQPGRVPPFIDDKLAHGIAFMMLMSWFCGVFELRFAWRIAVALLCLGVAIEGAQHLLTYRTAEFADGLADLAGILGGWALAVLGLERWASVIERWFARDTV